MTTSSNPHKVYDESVPRGAQALRDRDETERPTAGQSKKDLPAPVGYVDDRTGAAKGINFLMKKVFPDHWSFMLGEVAMYSMIIALVTGTILTLWFVPSMGHTVYDGSYVPLKDIGMSEAYASTLHISFEVRGGLLIRQLHHWSALLFIVSIALHMCRVFFTGAFRKPREINWVIGVVLSLLAIVEGFAGYSLPDDLLSGTGLRAMEGFVRSTPVIGSYLSFWIFGGEFPGELIISRLYIAHVLLLPAALVGLFTAHILLVMVHKHTQYPGPGRTQDNVVGFPMMPVYIAKAGGFFFIVFGLTALISALVTINAVWAYGPYEPTQVTAGSQPDFYMWFADGALRLLPGWLEFSFFGITLGLNIAIGAVFSIPIMWGIAAIYPFVEAWVTGDKREHHLLDRPHNAPTRTAIGAAVIAFYFVLAIACVNDIIAIKFMMSINDITIALRILLFVLPVIMFWVTRRFCISLQKRDREKVLHGRETAIIVRTADGKLFERHEPLDEYTRWPLVQHGERSRPLPLDKKSDERGVRRPGAALDGLRGALRRWYYADHVSAVTPAELAAAHHDHGDDHADEAHAVEGADDKRGLTSSADRH